MGNVEWGSAKVSIFAAATLKTFRFSAVKNREVVQRKRGQ